MTEAMPKEDKQILEQRRYEKLIQLLTSEKLINEDKRPDLIAIAKKTGLHKLTVHRIIAQKVKFSEFDSILAFAKGFHVPLSYFYGEVDEQNNCLVEHGDKLAPTIRKVIDIMDSETEYAFSLNENIKSFHNSVLKEKKIEELARQVDEQGRLIQEQAEHIRRLEERDSNRNQSEASTPPRSKPNMNRE